MQKLNGREYFIIVLMGLISLVLFFLLFRELFSESSPFVSSADGASMNVDKAAILNLMSTIINLTLCVIAFVFMLMKRRAGWIAAFCMLLFYAFMLCYAIAFNLMLGTPDAPFFLGVALTALLLMAIIFLFIPSTRKKFNITRSAIIPVILILGLIITFFFVIPR